MIGGAQNPTNIIKQNCNIKIKDYPLMIYNLNQVNHILNITLDFNTLQIFSGNNDFNYYNIMKKLDEIYSLFYSPSYNFDLKPNDILSSSFCNDIKEQLITINFTDNNYLIIIKKIQEILITNFTNLIKYIELTKSSFNDHNGDPNFTIKYNYIKNINKIIKNKQIIIDFYNNLKYFIDKNC